jgi:hypothetical protein
VILVDTIWVRAERVLTVILALLAVIRLRVWATRDFTVAMRAFLLSGWGF